LGWDPDQDVSQILREWARWFISPKHETALAQAVLDLEQDWHGPLLPRSSVDDTLRKVQTLERAATPQMLPRLGGFGRSTLRWFLDQGQGGFNGSIDIAEVFLVRN